MQNLAALSKELETAVEIASPWAVAVVGASRIPSSGVVWRPGVVVTNEHSLKREEGLEVALGGGRQAAATFAGRDAGTDLAVLRVDAGAAARIAEGLPKAGQLALLLGRSPNSGVNAALGMISAVSGTWRTWRGGQMEAYVRLDARVMAGSLGGPVLNPAGEVIGVSSGTLSRVAPLAVPAATVNRVVDEILARGRVARGFLGVGLQPVRVPESLQGKAQTAAGVMVLSVEPGGPAEQGGVLLGDVLLALNGHATADTDDVQAALGGESVGRAVTLKLLRGGELQELAVVVGERRA